MPQTARARAKMGEKVMGDDASSSEWVKRRKRCTEMQSQLQDVRHFSCTGKSRVPPSSACPRCLFACARGLGGSQEDEEGNAQ